MAQSKKRPLANEPIRPFLAAMFGVAFCYAFLFTEKIDAAAFAGLAGLVIGWFFRDRQEEKKEAQVTERVDAQIKAIMTPPPVAPIELKEVVK